MSNCCKHYFIATTYLSHNAGYTLSLSCHTDVYYCKLYKRDIVYIEHKILKQNILTINKLQEKVPILHPHLYNLTFSPLRNKFKLQGLLSFTALCLHRFPHDSEKQSKVHPLIEEKKHCIKQKIITYTRYYKHLNQVFSQKEK